MNAGLPTAPPGCGCGKSGVSKPCDGVAKPARPCNGSIDAFSGSAGSVHAPGRRTFSHSYVLAAGRSRSPTSVPWAFISARVTTATPSPVPGGRPSPIVARTQTAALECLNVVARRPIFAADAAGIRREASFPPSNELPAGGAYKGKDTVPCKTRFDLIASAADGLLNLSQPAWQDVTYDLNSLNRPTIRQGQIPPAVLSAADLARGVSLVGDGAVVTAPGERLQLSIRRTDATSVSFDAEDRGMHVGARVLAAVPTAGFVAFRVGDALRNLAGRLEARYRLQDRCTPPQQPDSNNQLRTLNERSLARRPGMVFKSPITAINKLRERTESAADDDQLLPLPIPTVPQRSTLAAWTGDIYQTASMAYHGESPFVAFSRSNILNGAPESYDVLLAHWTGRLWSMILLDVGLHRRPCPELRVDGLGNAHLAYYRFVLGRWQGSIEYRKFSLVNFQPGQFLVAESIGNVPNALKSISMRLQSDGEPAIVYSDGFGNGTYRRRDQQNPNPWGVSVALPFAKYSPTLALEPMAGGDRARVVTTDGRDQPRFLSETEAGGAFEVDSPLDWQQLPVNLRWSIALGENPDHQEWSCALPGGGVVYLATRQAGGWDLHTLDRGVGGLLACTVAVPDAAHRDAGRRNAVVTTFGDGGLHRYFDDLRGAPRGVKEDCLESLHASTSIASSGVLGCASVAFPAFGLPNIGQPRLRFMTDPWRGGQGNMTFAPYDSRYLGGFRYRPDGRALYLRYESVNAQPALVLWEQDSRGYFQSSVVEANAGAVPPTRCAVDGGPQGQTAVFYGTAANRVCHLRVSQGPGLPFGQPIAIWDPNDAAPRQIATDLDVAIGSSGEVHMSYVVLRNGRRYVRYAQLADGIVGVSRPSPQPLGKGPPRLSLQSSPLRKSVPWLVWQEITHVTVARREPGKNWETSIPVADGIQPTLDVRPILNGFLSVIVAYYIPALRRIVFRRLTSIRPMLWGAEIFVQTLPVPIDPYPSVAIDYLGNPSVAYGWQGLLGDLWTTVKSFGPFEGIAGNLPAFGGTECDFRAGSLGFENILRLDAYGNPCLLTHRKLNNGDFEPSFVAYN